MSDKPALPTSATVNPIDISFTNKAPHVYVKVDEPKGLSPRFEGPFLITSRPSRSQVEVRLGSYANGNPRLAVFHWSSCKIAHMREGAEAGERPKLGRPPKNPDSNPSPDTPPFPSDVTPTLTETVNKPSAILDEPAKIQTGRPVRATRNPSPKYVDAVQAFFT